MKRSAATWLIFAGFAFFAYYEARKLPFGSVSAPGAGFFPTVLSAGLAVIALAGLVPSLTANHTVEAVGTPLIWRKVLLTVALLVAFAAVFEFLGYLLTTFLFVVALLRGVERNTWTQAAIVAFSASLISYIIFGVLLGAPLPPGFLRA